MTDLVPPQTVLPFRPVSKGRRFYGLDWLRVFATLAVVVLHAGIPYMTHTLPGLVWAIYAPVRSDSIDLICWAINACIMPLFFIMSGYFAADLFKKQGANQFLLHRLKRLGGPYIFGVVCVLPLSMYMWLTGWITSGLAPFRAYRTLKVEQSLKDAVLGSAHLWYLLYLIIFCAGMWVLSQLTKKLHQQPSRVWSIFGVISGVAVMCFALTFYPRIVIGFRNSLFPLAANLTYYSVPFLLGWYWNSFPLSSMRQSNRHWWGMLVAACVVFATLWPNLVTHLEGENARVSNAAVPILFVIYGITISAALFGLSLNWNAPTPPPSVRYCAKATLWVYLFHHPVVALAQLSLLDWHLPVELKFGITISFSVAICLASYEVLGRRTWAAVILHGHRDVPRVNTLDAVPEIRKAA